MKKLKKEDRIEGESSLIEVKKKNKGEWVFSVYNTYMRTNPFSIIFTQDAENPNVVKTEMVYLFSIIPAVTYNFKF